MKFFVASCILVQVAFASAKVLPNNFPTFCSKHDPDYSKCMEKTFEKIGPYLLKGVKSIEFPKLHPLEITTFHANRTINQFVSIDSVLKNLQMYGFDGIRVENFKMNPETFEGQLHLVIPLIETKMEYDIKGKLFTVALNGAGFFYGNATNIDLLFDFKLKKINKLGVDYFAFDKFSAKSTIEGGYIKLIAKTPAQQVAADIITNFFNEDPKRTIDAVHPIYEESVEVFYRAFAERFLSHLPAKEFLPE